MVAGIPSSISSKEIIILSNIGYIYQTKTKNIFVISTNTKQNINPDHMLPLHPHVAIIYCENVGGIFPSIRGPLQINPLVKLITNVMYSSPLLHKMKGCWLGYLRREVTRKATKIPINLHCIAKFAGKLENFICNFWMIKV